MNFSLFIAHLGECSIEIWKKVCWIWKKGTFSFTLRIRIQDLPGSGSDVAKIPRSGSETLHLSLQVEPFDYCFPLKKNKKSKTFSKVPLWWMWICINPNEQFEKAQKNKTWSKVFLWWVWICFDLNEILEEAQKSETWGSKVSLW